MLKDAFLLALPVAVLAVGALVVLLFALAEAEGQFGAALVPVQVQWHERIALAFDGTGQAIELVPMHQQLAVPGGIRLEMG